MASSGTITGPRGTTAYSPWLILDWSIIDTDIPGNRSLVRLNLKLASDRNIIFSATKNGVLDGTSFSFTGNYNGPEIRSIKTKDVWVAHDSDGGRTETFSATFDLNITWSGEWLGRLTLSGSAVLNDIPRASDFTAFTLSNTVLNVSTATTINYTVARKSSVFDHLMTLKYGSKVIASWRASTGSLTRSLTATEVNSIIGSMYNTTSGTLTLTMQTMSGSTRIGGTKTINEGISLNSAIKPKVDSIDVAIYGSGRDKTLGLYIQGMTKVSAAMVGSAAGYGAGVTSYVITVKKSDGTNSQTIGNYAGTTQNPVTGSGTYVVTGTVRDSRGRTATISKNITVTAYKAPIITKFQATRIDPTSTVNIPFNASWSMATNNPATIELTRMTKAGVLTTLYSSTNNVAGSITSTASYTAQSDADSFNYILTVTDSFGNRARAEMTVGTSFVELTIAKGRGIGVGKVWQQGALDVAGDAYISGALYAELGAKRIPANGDLNTYTTPGFFFNPANAETVTIKNTPLNQAFSLLVEKHAGVKQTYTTYYATGWTEWIRNYYNGTWGRWYCMSHNQMDELWSGVYWMTATHVVRPTRAMSDCKNGWLLAFSQFNSGSAVDAEWTYAILPKIHRSGNRGHALTAVSGWGVASKYMEITDTTLTGHDGNSQDLRARVVLRGVYEW